MTRWWEGQGWSDESVREAQKLRQPSKRRGGCMAWAAVVIGAGLTVSATAAYVVAPALVHH